MAAPAAMDYGGLLDREKARHSLCAKIYHKDGW